MAWYSAGTVAVTNGSKNVTGAGTLWLTAGLKAGDVFTLDGEKVYQIESVTGEGALTLKKAWTGSTLSAQAYDIITSLGTRTNAELAAQLAALVANRKTSDDQTRDWLGGTANGGQNSDGTYPMTDAVGVTTNVKSPARMQADVDAVAASGTATIAALESGAKTVNLVAVDRIVAQATDITDVCIYDTSADSDGGAWRLRCEHTSWENETLSDNWLGLAANEAAARAITGATTNSYYHNTTDGKFYLLNASAGQTEVFRGSARKFPALALIVAHTAKVVIYDITDPAVPMWMVFNKGDRLSVHGGAEDIAAIAARDGLVAVGLGAGGASGGLSLLRFTTDESLYVYNSSSVHYAYHSTLSSRNAGGPANVPFMWGINGGMQFSRVVNDVAITVLPDAPIDVATGLPVPTIAVVTTGGVSVIKQDGTISSGSASRSYGRVAFGPDHTLFYGWSSNNFGLQFNRYPEWLTTSFTDQKYYGGVDLTYPSNSNTAGIQAAKYVALGNSRQGIALIKDSPATKTTAALGKDIRALITTAYNSGFLVGDARGAWLADATAETVASAELVTNGTFDTATTGWTVTQTTGTAVFSISSGALLVSNNGSATNGRAMQAITTVVGKTYTVTGRVVSQTHTATLGAYTSATGASGLLNRVVGVGNGSHSFTFVATTTTTYLGLVVESTNTSATASFDDVSCRIAVEDRSVKGKGARVFGSITKAAVAAGANLMGYSGFSAANYIEQPYNSDFDFGTTPFAFVFALKEASNTLDETMFERAYYTAGAYSGARFALTVLADGRLRFAANDGTNSVSVTTTNAVDIATWMTGIVVGYDGTNFRIMWNGVDLATPVARGSVGSLSNTNAVLRIGLAVNGGGPLTNGALALLRAGATWPSAEQAKFISEIERTLFQPNAQCTLGGTSDAVQSLAYDTVAERVIVGTADGTSIFQDLQRVAYIDQAGTPNSDTVKAVAGQGGAYAIATASEVVVNLPPKSLRDELERGGKRRAERRVENFWFTSTTGQTAFPLPVGWKPKRVTSAGSLRREGAASDYTVGFDGFLYTVTFAVSPGNGTSVAIEAEWSPQ